MDLFFFRDILKDCIMFMINLSNYYISNMEIKSISKTSFYTITLHLIIKEAVIKSTQEVNTASTNDISKLCLCFRTKDQALSMHQNLILVTKQKYISDHYVINDLLGEGAFGQVKLAINKSTKEEVAIKILDKQKLDFEQIQLVRNEIDIMTLCCHPNIVRLHEVIEDNVAIYIIMEYIRGIDLFAYLDEKIGLTERYIKHIMKQVLEAIKYLHSFGVVHRDMKLDNIMILVSEQKKISTEKIVPKIRQKIERESKKSLNYLKVSESSQFEPIDFSSIVVKLTDFGISKVIGFDEFLYEPIGTLRFSAPEILNGSPYTRQVDIWALGVCFFLLFSGCYPFEDKCKESTTQRILYDSLSFKSEIWTTASILFKDLIKCCLEKDPLKRITIQKLFKHEFFI